VAGTGDGAAMRRALVEQLRGQGLLRAPGTAEAFLAVPRERFLPELARRDGLGAVYVNDAIVTRRDARGLPISSSSQPSVMAVMLDLLDPRPGQRILEVGAGTGYNAALLAAIAGERGRVTTVEIDPEVAGAARAALGAGAGEPGAAEVIVSDGRAGWPPRAPYDRIIVTASGTEVPRAWYEQLSEGGIVVLPLLPAPGAQQGQVIIGLRRGPAGLEPVGAVCGGFMELRSDAAAGNRIPFWIGATEQDGEDARGLLQLSGESLARLAAPARRRLLALGLGEPRSRRLREPAPLWALATFLALATPPGRLLQLLTERERGIGVLDRHGGGLAVVAGAEESATHLLAWGAAEPAELLATLLGEWRALGRPGPERLRVAVRYGARRPRGRHWRVVRRGDSLLELDWAL
jgi:protein-L-isoaspartate(D-aspartate) O-methyltransferase